MLWRLTQGGESPASLRPDVVVVLIGTNNIILSSVESIALGIRGNVEVLRRAFPNATILVNEVFPRYDEGIPLHHLEPAVGRLNSLLHDHYVTHKTSEAIQYLQCGHLFVPTAEQHTATADPAVLVNTDLMPDRLHPNALGMKRWLRECVVPPALAAIVK